MKTLIAVTAIAFASCAPGAQDIVAAALPGFSENLNKALQSETQKDQSVRITAAVEAFQKKLSPITVDELEIYARRYVADRDGKSWTILPVFVVNGRLDTVAEITSVQLSTETQRQYRMWKWWETLFGGLVDYDVLSQNLGQAFLKRFENSDDNTRVVIADIFGKKGMTPEQFRQFIVENKPTKQ